VYLEWLSVFFQTGGFYQNRKTQDMSIDRAVSESVIARYKCLCFVQAKRTHVSEGDTTRTIESRKIGLLREELREKFFVFSFFVRESILRVSRKGNDVSTSANWMYC
jgi:hypothetical protein